MVGSNFLQTVTHDPLGELRAVALAAEVAQEKVAQIIGHKLLGAISGCLIGEMAVAAENALLETPGSVETVLQHFDIVIGFQ